MKRKFANRSTVLGSKRNNGQPKGIENYAWWYAMDPLQNLRRKLGTKASDKVGRKRGHLFGYKLKTLENKRKKAAREAKRLYKYMTDKKMFAADNNVAEEAMTEVLSLLRAPGHPRDKLAAAKTLLEYTQRKPVASNEVTINKAEAFLDAVLEDMSSGTEEAVEAFDATEDTNEDGSTSS